MNAHHLRAILLKLQDRLTDDDRKRLHFFFGNDVPRRIRDDPSLGGTLSLMESLFDQDKINEEDFTFLINAFEAIQCIDTAKLLREHMRQREPSEIKSSMKSLVEILPITMKELFDDQESDTYDMEFRESFLSETNMNDDHDNMAINDKDDKNINSITTPTDDQTRLPLQSKQKRYINDYIRSNISKIAVNVRWSSSGVTVAGGNGKGNATNQLIGPSSFCVEDDQTVIITDTYNHRIVQWEKGDTDGKVVAGGNGSGKRLNQLYYPTDVLIDKATDSLIICDWMNERVVRWPCHSSITQGDVIIDQIDCYGLAMDDQKYLYVSNTEKNEVRLYQSGDRNGTLVAGGNDNNNHRVMKWTKYATESIVIAGGQGGGSSLTQLYHPGILFVDNLRTVYVAGSKNQRVMRWPQGATQGSVIVGGNGEGAEADQFSTPIGVSFDQYGNLYVADEWNHRVQRFSLE
ncbi:unnamed protein product [Rotaria socialis]|uniref:DED domain-containing protein n=1 Tax=Rotaria socialis TaxID=392032 RepID=A0A820VFZ6_9BILA|nr:unnamed protein product [Rotaria socialis]